MSNNINDMNEMKCHNYMSESFCGEWELLGTWYNNAALFTVCMYTSLVLVSLCGMTILILPAAEWYILKHRHRMFVLVQLFGPDVGRYSQWENTTRSVVVTSRSLRSAYFSSGFSPYSTHKQVLWNYWQMPELRGKSLLIHAVWIIK